jgi:hypothetical protein
MRGAALLVAMALVGCATARPAPTAPTAPAAPAKDAKADVAKKAEPGKNEVVVIGKGQAPIPGLRPTEQETEFTIYHGKPYRCTKVKASPEHPRGQEWCRDLSNGTNGNPDTGLIDRGPRNIRQDP